MQRTMVITVAGRDRTGVVESLARIIADSGGNWLESRMCRLGGEFAGILRASAPEERMEGLVYALKGLQSDGMTVSFQKDEAVPPVCPTRTATLSLIGQDRPGIIYHVSSALAHHNINVEELETEFASAPMSGEMIFKAMARLHIPETCEVSLLRKELEEMGNELMVELSFTSP